MLLTASIHFAQILPTLCAVSSPVHKKESNIVITAIKAVKSKVHKTIISLRIIIVIIKTSSSIQNVSVSVHGCSIYGGMAGWIRF